MVRTQKLRKPLGRDERHSAAWGKRLALMLVLASSMAFGQVWRNPSETGRFLRMSPELSGMLAQAKSGTTHGRTVKVIVQYKQVPTASHYATMHGRGGLLHSKLHMIKAASFTIPVGALPALEADPEIASVTIDHPMKLMDDTTDAVIGASSAWNSGFTGAWIGVAVIDSGINDNHPDLWDSTQSYSRVVYRQDFTGTATSNSNGANYDLYGH